jgi:hypothetical protein
MKNAVKTGLRDFFVSAVAIFSGHKIALATTFCLKLLKALDVVKWSHSWPGKWRFNSDFRIIKISQKPVLRYGIAVS